MPRFSRLRLFVALVLGAAVNVLVSWTIVLVVAGDESSYTLEGGPLAWPHPMTEGSPPEAGWLHRHEAFGWERNYYGKDVWAERGSSQQRDRYFRQVTETSGWPLRSMVAHLAHEVPVGRYRPWVLDAYRDRPWSLVRMGFPVWRLPDFLVRNEWQTDAWWSGFTGHFRFRRIPLVPMALPFAINTLIYGVLLYGLLTLRARWVCGRRLRRGVCPRCRYSREGMDAASPCPECAWVPARAGVP